MSSEEKVKRFELVVSASGSAAYLRLPTYPTGEDPVRMSRSIELIRVLGQYEGPEVIIDFGPDGTLVGIEILGGDEAEED